jgi:hypothetical protein
MHCSRAEGEGQPHAAARQEAGLACRDTEEGRGAHAHAAAVEETQKLSL